MDERERAALTVGVLYRSVCAECGRSGLTPRFTDQPQWCNRDCEARWEARQEGAQGAD